MSDELPLTYNPEVDFEKDVYMKSIYDFFRPAIVYFIYTERWHIQALRKYGDEENIDDRPIAERVWDNPRLLETIVCNHFAHPDDIFSELNKNEFNGERVIFNNIDKLKKSEFFLAFCQIIDYIEHMPNLEEMIHDVDEKARRNSERIKNEQVMLININSH